MSVNLIAGGKDSVTLEGQCRAMTEIPDLIRFFGASGTRQVEPDPAASGDDTDTGTPASFQLELLKDDSVAILPPADLATPAGIPFSAPSWHTSETEHFVFPKGKPHADDTMPEALPGNASALVPHHDEQQAQPLSLPAQPDGLNLRSVGEIKVPARPPSGEIPVPKPNTPAAEAEGSAPRRKTAVDTGMDTVLTSDDKKALERENAVERIVSSSPEPRAGQTGPAFAAPAPTIPKALAPAGLSLADPVLVLQAEPESVAAAEGVPDLRNPGTGNSASTVPIASTTTSPSGHRTPDMIAQIASRLTETGTKELTIRLDPPELGSVRIVLSGSDGSLSASIIVDRVEVDQFLRRHADELESALAEAGYGSVDLEFSDNPPDQEKPLEFDPSQGLETIGTAPDKTAVYAATPVSGLDIRL
ncbi:flagellar hook-length control protein FliK [Halovulum sp. GXIMD14794]